MPPELSVLLISLVLTLAFECGLAFILGIRERSSLELVALAQCLTNPLVVAGVALASSYLNPTFELFVIVVLELAAILVEARLYAGKLNSNTWAGRELLFSVFLNTFSFALGLVLTSL